MTDLIPLYFSSQIGGYDHKIVGIPNLGNYCFANSFLQTLYSSKNIRQRIIDLSDDLFPTDAEFKALFKNKLLHDDMSSFIELKIKSFSQDDSDPSYLKIVAKFDDDFNIQEVDDLGNDIQLISHPFKFKIKSTSDNSFTINNIKRNIKNIDDIEYTFMVKKEHGKNWNGKIYLTYTDYFNTQENIEKYDNRDLRRKLKWFSTDSIKKGDVIEIMRFKYLIQLFRLLNRSKNTSILDGGAIKNIIKGIVATIVNTYSWSGGVDQSDSGEILLKIGYILEKIFPINNLLKVVDLNQYLIKKSSGEVVIKTKDKERDPNRPEVINMVLNAYECPKSSCTLKDIYPIYLNKTEFETSVNTITNIEKLSRQDDSNWARVNLTQSIKDNVGSDEELYCLKDESEIRSTVPNQWGSFSLIPVHKCEFHSKSNLADKEFYCANSMAIMTPFDHENIPNFLLFYNSRTNPGGGYNKKNIIFNLYEIFFGKHYILTGITVHSGGGTGGGHYISKVRHDDNNYYYISDSTIGRIPFQQMLNDTSRWSLLVYERIPDLNQNIIDCNK